VVLVASKYHDTVSGTVPYTVANPPQVATVNTSGTADMYDSGGSYASGNYNSKSTVTMPGGSTTYNMPQRAAQIRYRRMSWCRSVPPRSSGVRSPRVMFDTARTNSR
jgi:hypothetical protein